MADRNDASRGRIDLLPANNGAWIVAITFDSPMDRDSLFVETLGNSAHSQIARQRTPACLAVPSHHLCTMRPSQC